MASRGPRTRPPAGSRPCPRATGVTRLTPREEGGGEGWMARRRTPSVRYAVRVSSLGWRLHARPYQARRGAGRQRCSRVEQKDTNGLIPGQGTPVPESRYGACSAGCSRWRVLKRRNAKAHTKRLPSCHRVRRNLIHDRYVAGRIIGQHVKSGRGKKGRHNI